MNGASVRWFAARVRCNFRPQKLRRNGQWTAPFAVFAAACLPAPAFSATNDPPSPEVKWEVAVGHSDSSPALGADGTIYFGTFVQKFFAVSTNGHVNWTFPTESEIKSSPAVG